MKTLYILIGVLYCTATFAQTEISVKNIRKAVKQINADKSLTTRIIDNAQISKQGTDGGDKLTGYYKNGQLVKIVESIGLSSCMNITEYYLQDNKLIFVYAQGKEFKYEESLATYNSSVQIVTMESRFYFQDDKLVKSILTGSTRCSDSPLAGWSTNYQEKFLQYVKLLPGK